MATDTPKRTTPLSSLRRTPPAITANPNDRVRIWHRTYCMLRVGGLSSEQAAARINRNLASARRWERQAWWPNLERECLEAVTGNKLGWFSPMLEASKRVILQALSEGNVDVAMWVSEQVYGRATTRVEEKSEQQLEVVVRDRRELLVAVQQLRQVWSLPAAAAGTSESE